jgi:hypothetical protein
MAMLCYIFLTGKGFHTPALYSDFIATDLAYFGYDKKFELRAVQIFLGTALLSTPIVIWMFEKHCARSIDRVTKNCFNMLTLIPGESKKFAANLKIRLLNSNIDAHIAVLSCLYLSAICFFYKNYSYFGYFLVNLCILYNLRSKLEMYIQLIISGLIFYYLLHGAASIVDYYYTFLPSMDSYIINRLFKSITMLFYLIMAYFINIDKLNINQILRMLQVPLPLLLIRICDYRYEYSGKIIPLFDTSLLNMITLGIVVPAIAYNMFVFSRKKEINIYITTVVCFAVYSCFPVPSPYFLNDMFHNGERSVPLQQLLTFGKIPFVDYMPVHGLCDYFFAALGRIFFDGTYASLSAGTAIGTIIFACILFFTFYHKISNKYYCVLFALLSGHFIGYRWVMLYLAIALMLYSVRSRSFIAFFTEYAWLCLANILWYPALGACYALGMFPMLIYNFRYSSKKINTKQLLLYLAALAVFFVSLFFLKDILLGIVSYIWETTRLTAETHGTAFITGIKNMKMLHICLIFSFIPAVIFLFITSLQLYRKDIEHFKFFLIFTISIVLMVIGLTNYMFVRFDTGGRIWPINYILLFLIIPSFTIFYSRSQIVIASYFITLFAVAVMPHSLLANIKYTKAVYINNSTVMPESDTLKKIGNLGKIFITQGDLDFLLGTRKYLDKISSNGSFILLSGKLSLYAIFNSECPTKYVTPMNIEGKYKQNDVIRDIESKNIDICLLDMSNFDPRFQTYRIYNYLLKHRFKFSEIIGDTIFLVKQRDLPVHALGKEAVVQYFEKYKGSSIHYGNDIGSLPAAWSGASKYIKPVQLKYTVEYADIKKENGLLRCTGNSPSITFRFKEKIEPMMIDFIQVSFERNDGKPLVLSLNFREQDGWYSDKAEIRFFAGAKNNRLPTLTNPHWLYSENINEIRVIPKRTVIGDTFTCEVQFENLKE